MTQKTKIYYWDKDANSEDIKKLANQREPSNISMIQHYNEANLVQWSHTHGNVQDGYKVGYYQQYYDTHSKIAPNIAIYTYTPVFINDFKSDPSYVHMIHVIGYAFDAKEQPDYKYFFGENGPFKEDKEVFETLQAYYTNIFHMIYLCAELHELDTVVLSLFGAFNFIALLNDPQRAQFWTIYIEACKQVQSKYRNINTKYMGLDQTFKLNTEFYLNTEDIGKFPDNIMAVNRRKTLFVNAWDPHTVIGNGNNCDNSLDGFVGRCTAVAILGHPTLNPYINDKSYYNLYERIEKKNKLLLS